MGVVSGGPIPYMIPTSQDTLKVVESDVPLAFGGVFSSEITIFRGYSVLCALVITDQSTLLEVTERCDSDAADLKDGVVTESALTAVDPVTGKNFLCKRFEPCGKFGSITITNKGLIAQTFLRLCVYLLPIR